MAEHAATFRRLSRADVDARTRALNEESVLDGILMEVPVGLAPSERWFERIQTDSSRRDFALAREGEAVGFSGLVNISQRDRTAELYIFMPRAHQGRGLGSVLLEATLRFALLELNLRKITLYVTISNTAAMRFYERAGFFREAVLKEHVWHRGAYRDRVIYSRFLAAGEADRSAFYGALS
ncbi:GNAT family N-acetyltransferase [Ancylobacter dichloromethanicus]|uniref:Spermidine N1-acetyltransferase n=1 Tax=Ancylobacter dichloromethanicus TaxID=518825 RepID=A0A9W6J7Z6_9HYPH|nr:GNAT family protein [Ancylobacter dichloromethanicus]MBS7556574.1 GNAT family N-acetyltransferase [Ancylobacter dichloromethanicus]GLK72525.1 spermidine N1-acetyltransferase [Ancylobacter dichloromethanicus]